MRPKRERPLFVGMTTVIAVVTTMTVGALSASGAEAPAPSAAAGAGSPHRVQLITGDVVQVQEGNAVGIQPAAGRENIPVHISNVGGHSMVVPLDAQRLISTGTVDSRLFDVTLLDTPAARKSYRNGLKVIVGYQGAAPLAHTTIRETTGTTVRHDLRSLNAQAITTKQSDLPELWKAVTAGAAPGITRAATGIGKIWLDATVQAQLDVSVPQIGADKAWAAGFDGTGVKVAVLDTGIDETHPDLVGQQLVEKNFSESPDTKDRQGHGTHVASTIAGTGAKSGGKYRGVAPGAKLIDGKVLDDTGSGDESGIILAIEWAVGEGADIVSMSLGGPDTPGVEPLEETVNTYTDQGVLFTIAAGNEGRSGEGTVGTPGSADGALTVGAVDSKDTLAAFSSRGPRIGDGAIKPDVTAPGVDITAASAPGSVIAKEYGENPAGYTTISGTSMATPHVAGAAAILKQQHPGWRAAELKGVLTGSTKDVGYTAFEQGSGRIQVNQAIEQNIYASPNSLSLGTAAYPHDDDEPITRTVTYRNAGASEITLDLTASGKGPGGAIAPADMFTVAPAQLTIPAGGSAQATLRADTRVEAPDGRYSGAIVASGGGQSVRTAFAVEREVPARTVRLEHLGRDGRAAAHFQTYVTGLSDQYSGYAEYAIDEHSDSTTLRLPIGEYTIDSMVIADRSDLTKGVDWIAQPKLVVGQDDVTVTLDARTTKPVDITVPDRDALNKQAYMSYGVKVGYRDNRFAWRLGSYHNFRSAHLGPELTDGSLTQVWSADFVAGADTQYSLIYGGQVNRLSDGFTKHNKRPDLAAIDAGLGATAPGKTAWVSAVGRVKAGSSTLAGWAFGRQVPARSRQKLYVSTENAASWTLFGDQVGDPLPNGWLPSDTSYMSSNKTFEANRTRRVDFNTGVFGPVLDKAGAAGIIRSGDTLYAFLSVFSDGTGNQPTTLVDGDPVSATTTLYRNGEKVSESDNELNFASFPLAKEDSQYTLSTSQVRNDRTKFQVGTRIDADWTFRSKTGDSAEVAASTIRFHPEVDLQSTAKAGRPMLMPYEIQGSAAGSNLKSLTVGASYDSGKTWIELAKVAGRYSLRAPGKGQGVALRAEIVDKQDNKSTLTFYDAFLGQ